MHLSSKKPSTSRVLRALSVLVTSLLWAQVVSGQELTAFIVFSGPCIASGSCLRTRFFGGEIGHGPDEYCLISAPVGAKIAVTSWEVENDDDSCSNSYDWLQVNGERYCGESFADSPDDVVITDPTMIWKSDYAELRGGWEICIPPAIVNSPGPCIVNGNCVASPNYPNNYNNNDKCYLSATMGASISVTSFDTEAANDYLTINGQQYSGNGDGLDGVVLTDSSFTWDSNDSVTNKGWEICFVWPFINVDSGPCQKEGDCVSSGNYGSDDYDDNEQCTITAPVGSLINVVSFDTESDVDILNVNGLEFSGEDGTDPTGFISLNFLDLTQETIIWASDSSTTGPGWKICFLATVNSFPGPCVTTEDCATSPNFPTSDYINNDRCYLYVTYEDYTVAVSDFQTQSSDTLLVNGESFSGPGTGLDGLVLTDPSVIWQTDSADTDSGWKFCMVEPTSQPSTSPSTSPSSSPSTSPLTGTSCPYEPPCELLFGKEGIPLKKTLLSGACTDRCTALDFVADFRLKWGYECGRCDICPLDVICKTFLGQEGVPLKRTTFLGVEKTCTERCTPFDAVAYYKIKMGYDCGYCEDTVPEPEDIPEIVCPSEDRCVTLFGLEGTPLSKKWFFSCLDYCIIEDSIALDLLEKSDYECGACP